MYTQPANAMASTQKCTPYLQRQFQWLGLKKEALSSVLQTGGHSLLKHRPCLGTSEIIDGNTPCSTPPPVSSPAGNRTPSCYIAETAKATCRSGPVHKHTQSPTHKRPQKSPVHNAIPIQTKYQTAARCQARRSAVDLGLVTGIF